MVLKPVIDELFLKHTSDLALSQEDHLLGRILYPLNEDSHWHREWSQSLIQTAIEDTATNRNVIRTWIDKWYANALNAIEVSSPLFEGKPGGPQVPPFHKVGSRIDAFCDEFLRSMNLQPGSMKRFSADW